MPTDPAGKRGIMSRNGTGPWPGRVRDNTDSLARSRRATSRFMKRLATLTMNPSIDVAYAVDRIAPTHKLRASEEHYGSGGGGLNVARVIARLGGTARAHYLAGGATGSALTGLLDLHQIVRSHLPIAGATRVSTAVYERETGQEYRFVPRGPTLAEGEWKACLEHLRTVECDILVASGSLPPGVPDDFYARVQHIARARGIRLIVDTSGPALRAGLAAGGLLLVKPSLDELRQLTGRPLADRYDIAAAAMAIVEAEEAELVAVTMGADGALLARCSGVIELAAVRVDARGAVGAGDSFLAAMTFALACDRDPLDAFRYGVAAGAAAVLSPGLDLCRRDEVERLYRLVGPCETIAANPAGPEEKRRPSRIAKQEEGARP